MPKSRHKIHLSSKSGFTLLEVMAAVAVLVVIVMPLLNMFEKAASQGIKSGAETAALQAAQNLLESHKAEGLDWLLEQEAKGLLPSTMLPGTFSNGDGHYAYHLQLARCENSEPVQAEVSGLEQQYLLTATVCYAAAQGEQKISLTTLVQRRWHY